MCPSQGQVEGSIPSSRSDFYAGVAQLVEQSFRKAGVGSSTLPFGSEFSFLDRRETKQILGGKKEKCYTLIHYGRI